MTTNTFIAGKGLLYHMDPRAKICALLLFIVGFFLPVTLLGLFVSVLLLVVLSLISVGLKASTKVLLSILPMLVFMLLFMPFNQRQGEPLLIVGSFTLVTREGLSQMLLLSLRFIGITYSCSLLLFTTRMNEVMLALLWYHLGYKVVLVITLSLTYIPFISDSFHEISDSHKLRHPFSGSEKLHIRVMLPTLTSALVVSLRSIPFLAMSLEQRGYGRTNKRTRYHSLSGYRHTVLDFFFSFWIVFFLFFLFRK